MNSFLHRFYFLSRFLLSPKKIGSITPSSRFLIQALLEPIDWHKLSCIVELGAGTGVVTEEIERRRRTFCLPVIFEMDPYLSQLLQKKYPTAEICSDASRLRMELKRLGMNQVSCVVSSLPFANFTLQERFHILQEIRQGLTSDGLFVAYQYSLQLKPLLEEFFQQIEVRFVPFNLPPAFVYICK